MSSHYKSERISTRYEFVVGHLHVFFPNLSVHTGGNEDIIVIIVFSESIWDHKSVKPQPCMTAKSYQCEQKK